MPSKIVFSTEQLTELRTLIDSGMRQTDIAKHFNVTDDTIRRICREQGWKIRMPHKCTCILCGDVFYSNIKGAKTCKKEHHRNCVICGKDFIVDRTDIKDTCSRECTSFKKYGVKHHLQAVEVKQKRVQTNLERYGVDNPGKMPDHLEKCEATNLKKYGAKSYAGSVEGRAHTRKTNLEKYGCEEPLADPEYRAKIASINIEKYGTEHPMRTDAIKHKQQMTLFNNYGVTNPMQSPEIVEHFQENLYAKYGYRSVYQIPEVKNKISNTCQDRYGVKWACMRPEARKLSPSDSGPNRAFAQLLESHDTCYEREFGLDNYSYDFKCGNTLIEVNPTSTHNTIMSIHPKIVPISFDYHLNKTETAINAGFRCINLFDWDDPESIVKIISKKLPIYARRCKVIEIDVPAASRFINQYHLQGQCRGTKIALGLLYNGQVVQVMTFGKPRYNRKFEWELLRLCTKSDNNVIGGASKLFAYFVNKYTPQSVISYCDAAKFSGHVYLTMGMQLAYRTDPAKIWSKGTKHITDNLLRQRGYDQLFNTTYGKGTSNEQLMLDNGWLPVYDCGQKVFVYTT